MQGLTDSEMCALHPASSGEQLKTFKQRLINNPVLGSQSLSHGVL